MFSRSASRCLRRADLVSSIAIPIGSPKRGEPVYSVSWQVESSILTLRRQTAREAVRVAELQIFGNCLVRIADATGETISLDELLKRVQIEAETNKS